MDERRHRNTSYTEQRLDSLQAVDALQKQVTRIGMEGRAAFSDFVAQEGTDQSGLPG